MPTISILSRILHLMAPRSCVVCGRRLGAQEEVMCASCDLSLPRTYHVEHAEDNEMARLFWKQLPVERAAALFYYHGHSSVTHILFQLKYHHRPSLGVSMGQMIAREWQGNGFFDGIDVIVPVPLAPRRQRQRGYNQSMEIARGISTVTGIPIVNDAVGRTTFHGSQTRLQRWSRMENVSQSFVLLNPELVAHRHVLLIDDVCTTGATLIACGQQLAKAPGVRVSLLTLGFAPH